MIRALIRFALRRFDRRYDYDSSYLLDLYDVSPGAFRRFARVSAAAGFRRRAPVEAYFAAKITAALAEGCGPCTQLCLDMAREAGMEPEQVHAVVGRDEGHMSDDARLGFRFAASVLGTEIGDPAAHDEVRGRWGDAALAELALCVTTARMFPQMKRGLGRARSCQALRIDGYPSLPPKAPAPT